MRNFCPVACENCSTSRHLINIGVKSDRLLARKVRRHTPTPQRRRGPRPGQVTALGPVLPATSLARATAVQRLAGIQYPVAVGSVRVWTERPPRADRSSERPPMAYFYGSTNGKLSRLRPSIAEHSDSRSAGHRRGVSPETARIYRQRDSTGRSPDKPHGCWVLRLEFTVNVGIAPTVNFSRELDATLLPSDLPSNWNEPISPHIALTRKYPFAQHELKL
jgi:hypothetical protein